MFSRSTILLAMSAVVLSTSPAAAQENPVISEETSSDDLNAQINDVDTSSVDVMGAIVDGFDEIYKRADASGLKATPSPIKADFLLTEVTPPWAARNFAELQRFIDAAPPKMPDIEQAADNLEAWTNYLQIKGEEALQSGDRIAFRAAQEDILFITAADSNKSSTFGPTDEKYIGALGMLLMGLDPAPEISEQDLKGVMTDDPATKDSLRSRTALARSNMSNSEKELLLTAGAQYLAIVAAENLLGQDDVQIIEQRTDLLVAAGRKPEADALGALALAINRNANIDQYNAMINYRQQNIEIFAFDNAASWDLSGLLAARAFMKDEDPLLLRYSLLVAADAVAAGNGRLADKALEIARASCAVQKCGNLENTQGYLEGAALLKSAKLDDASKRLRIALQAGSAQDPADEALADLKFKMIQCYGTAESEKRGSTERLTRAGEITAARCDSQIGAEILRIRKSRGETAKVDGEYRSVLLESATASAKLGEWRSATAMLGELNPILRAELNSPVEISIVGSLLAEAQIALKDFSGADLTIAQKRQDAEQMYAEGALLPHAYRNELEAVAGLQVARLIAEDSRAAEAFEPASQVAARQRAFREGLSTKVEDETVLLRALGAQNSFTPLLDAAYARRQTTPQASSSIVAAAFIAAQDATLDPTSIAVAMSAAADSAVAGDPELARLVQRRRQLLDELSPHVGVDADFKFALDTKSTIVQRQEQAAIELKMAEYETLDAKLRNQFPDYFKLIRPRALSVEEAKILMQPDEAALLVVPTERGTHTLLISREGISWHRAELKDEALSKMVKRLLWFAGGNVHPDTNEIAEWSQGVDGGKNGFDRDTAYLLYQNLILPHSNALTSKRKIYISALGAIGSLPLGLLVTDTPQGRDDDIDALQSTKWLADDYAIAQIPSLQSLAFLRQNASPSRGNTFFGVGDPVLSRPDLSKGTRGLEREIAPEDVFGAAPDDGSTGLAGLMTDMLDETAPTNALANVDLLRQLPELDGTGRELRAMALAFGQGEDALRLRDRARESELKTADLSGVNVLVFATHGLLAGELKPGQSPGLVMTPPDVASLEDDGLLTAPEIARLKLAADWVILSACNTAAGDGTDGAAPLSGLARAFFYAGARSLLVSHWPVLDDMSSTITVRSVNLQRANPLLSRAESFQQAQREVRSQRRWAHPRSWAPFVFIGDASVANIR